MANALLTDLSKQLGSFAAQQALQELQLLAGVDEEVQKLEDNLKTIEAVLLDDAEKRQMKQRTEKLWLEQLQDVYYWMDDVLDSWNTASIKLKIQKEEEEKKAADSKATALKKKVWSFFPSISFCFRQVDNLSLRHGIGHKIKKLNETFDKILKHRVMLGIDLNRKPEVVERPPTTSFVDVSNIIDRGEYWDDLLKNLLGMGSQEESNPRVISLVGMGCIGKSTLAQFAYNHDMVKAYFEKRMWVCVSDSFDQCKVAKAIIQELEPKAESLNNVTEMGTLLDIIKHSIRDKKFFLVLDDVWAKDSIEESKKWDPFKNALICGAQGSRILVTTRNKEVARMMGSVETHIINLKEFSIDECWLIIRKVAFFGDNLEQYNYLEDLGKQLAIKCKGLPLVAKTLGSHMHGKKNKVEWEMALHSSLWELEGSGKGILGPLLLSYYELSPAEKQCFLYCAVFPKDHSFNRLELVIGWMAQGYIDSNAKMEMEVTAEHYFENLVVRSFFQDFEKDKNNGRIKSYKMHDIVHDFAESMAKDVCLTINCDDKVEKNFKRVRHLSLKVKETSLELVYEAKNLRFLNLNFLSSSKTVQPKLFDHLRCLRTLHLKGKSILTLPNKVEKLIHLRYLKLYCDDLKELPESICNLCNLQSLDVSECRKLEKLPQAMGKLINLRHLLLLDDFFGIKMKSFPKGIGGLTSLRTFSYFHVGVGGKGEEICKLGELEHLNHIQGRLVICGLKNVVDFGAIENTLKKKDHLRDLRLFFGTTNELYGEEEETEEERRRKIEKDVAILNALEPPPRLESLLIDFYEGTTMYPNWMMSKLTNLKRLTLFMCLNLEQLPPLGKLPLLEQLGIDFAPMIRKVGDEFLGIDIEEEELSESSKNNNNKDIIVFPNLKFLHFWNLEEWEEWTRMGGTIEEEEEEKDNRANAFVTNNTPKIKIMPLLHSLTIEWCGKLKSLPDYLRNTPLKKLGIIECRILERRCNREIGDYWPNISHIPNIWTGFGYVQRDGQLPDSIDDSEMHDDVVEVDKTEDSNQVVETNIDEGDL